MAKVAPGTLLREKKKIQQQNVTQIESGTSAILSALLSELLRHVLPGRSVRSLNALLVQVQDSSGARTKNNLKISQVAIIANFVCLRKTRL